MPSSTGLQVNTTGLDIEHMKPGQVFQTGDGQQWEYHKPTAGGTFHVVKPVGGGKAKVFHKLMQPPMVGPAPAGGESGTSFAPDPKNALGFSPEDPNALFDQLAKSVEMAQTGGAAALKAHPNDPTKADYVAVQNKTAGPDDLHNSPGRGPTGKLRNFKAMSVGKLKAVVSQLQSYGKDQEALAAAQAALAKKS